MCETRCFSVSDTTLRLALGIETLARGDFLHKLSGFCSGTGKLTNSLNISELIHSEDDAINEWILQEQDVVDSVPEKVSLPFKPMFFSLNSWQWLVSTYLVLLFYIFSPICS